MAGDVTPEMIQRQYLKDFGIDPHLYDLPPISGGAIAPLALMLLPLLPQVVNGIMTIYDTIANHPTTPEATGEKIRALVADIRAINATMQAAPLPGDEPGA